MAKYTGTFDDMLHDCDISRDTWGEFVSIAKDQLAKHPNPTFSPEDYTKILSIADSCEEDVDNEDLTSRHYDPDPYGVGGCYSCADNWSCDEGELAWETFKIFLKRMLEDLLLNYADLSAPELEDEEVLGVAATYEAIEYVWDNWFNDNGKNPLF